MPFLFHTEANSVADILPSKNQINPEFTTNKKQITALVTPEFMGEG